MTTPNGGDYARVADPAEFGVLRQIEAAADELFREIGIGPFSPSEAEDHLNRAAAVFASGDPPVGFACVEVVDGVAHLWQLSVHPSAGQQGRGTALVGAVTRWAAAEGYEAVTLTTFRDVAWNAPFYAKLGFQPLDKLTPGLAAIREHERQIGDDAFGARITMRKELRHRRHHNPALQVLGMACARGRVALQQSSRSGWRSHRDVSDWTGGR